MSVWITMDMSYVGAGDYDNTSKVSVNVYAHWDTVSWNGEGAPLTVTVDGVSDSSTVTFNTNKTSSGSQNIYSRYWNIGHDSNGSARTVSATASFTATSNSGSLPASDSLDLPAISSGGGSGGDSGDSGDDDTYYQIIVQGVGASVSVTSNSSDGSYPYYKAGTTLKISVSSSSGYNLTSCYIDGVETTYVEKVINSDIYIVVESEVVETTIIQSGLYIDDGSNSSLYECYIDTECVKYPINNISCTVIGQRSGNRDSSGNMTWYSSASSYNTEYSASWSAGYDSSGSRYNVYFLKFTTPELCDTSKELKVEIKMQNNSYYSESDPTVRYALCTSDENYSLYLDTLDAVNDPYQIATGTFQEVNGDGEISTILIETDELRSNTTYYLLIWDAHRDNIVATSTTAMPASNHVIILSCEDRNNPIYYSEFIKYIPYIDTGATWIPF